MIELNFFMSLLFFFLNLASVIAVSRNIKMYWNTGLLSNVIVSPRIVINGHAFPFNFLINPLVIPNNVRLNPKKYIASVCT